MECLFCKIAEGTISAKIIYRDDYIVAFNDINPQSPHHIVLIPIKHIANLNEVSNEDTQLLGHMLQSATSLAKKLSISEDGYRIVMNCNTAGGQTVYHIHMHLLGGRQMTWPPG